MGPRAVAEYQGITSPCMRAHHFNIAGVAWSNFKPGVNTNGRVAIAGRVDIFHYIDVVRVSCGVDEALVALRGGGEGGGWGGGRGGGGGA